MKLKIFLLAALVSSLFGYLEWGFNNASFLLEAEWALITKFWSAPKETLHPFTVIPFLGQLFLLIAFLQKEPIKALVFSGLSGLTLLLGFMLFIGLFGMNWKITLSVLPFLSFAYLIARHFIQQKRQKNAL